MLRTLTDRLAFALVGALSLLLVAVLAGDVRGGPLDPPGTPGSTMKTLQEVEPRTAIQSLTTSGDATNQYRIFTPGSYYLTGNINGVVGKNGIQVNTNNVTIDLNGFAMIGVAGSLDGINIPGGRVDVAVRNGSVRNWGGDGIDASAGFNFLFADLIAELNGGDGLRIGNQSSLTRCESKDNTGDGIETGAGATVTECGAYSNTGVGIRLGDASVLTDCVSHANTDDGVLIGLRGIVSNCTASQNSGDGFQLGGSAVLRDSNASVNGFGAADGAGVHAASSNARIEGNISTGADRGLDVDFGGSVIIGNQVSGNTVEYDIVANNLVGPFLLHADMAAATNPYANFEN